MKKDYISQGEKSNDKLLEAAQVAPDGQRCKMILRAEYEAFICHIHLSSCYATFIKASKRISGKSTHQQSSSESPETVKSPGDTRANRQNFYTKKICVAYSFDQLSDKKTQTKVDKLFCLCETHPAQKLMNPAKLNQNNVFMGIVFC